MEAYYFAEDKFSEAQFFLGLMRKNTDKISDFRYYFSAFLSAARSISLIFKTQAENYPRLKIAYEEHFKKDSLMKYFVDSRNHTVHQGNLLLRKGVQRFIGDVESEFGRYRWNFTDFPSDLKCENDVIEISEEVLDVICKYLLEVGTDYPDL